MKTCDSVEDDILARTLYGEARGERVKGLEAVACVILNRVKKAKEKGGLHWWGNTVVGVCQKPWQFSCWNADDPNREKILQADANNKTFKTCLRVAERALAGELTDATKGATHYHSKRVMPPWAKGKVPTTVIGSHLFYNDID